MRAPSSQFHPNAETRRRSGPKQSRTERRERFERRALGRQNTESGVENRFGIKLQAAVDKALAALAIPHRSIDHKDAVARDERIELILLNDERTTSIAEVQFTLRRGIRGKIEDFLRAAIVRPLRDVPRFYLEIEDHIGLNLKPMAERVAHAIRDLLDEIGDWAKRAEPGNAIGVAIVFDHHQATKFFPIRLASLLGSQARKTLAGLFASIEAAKQAAKDAFAKVELEAKRKLARLALSAVTRSSTTFHMVVSVRDSLHGFRAHPVPAFATSQVSHPLRMPFRR